MFRRTSALVLASLLCAGAWAQKYPGVGRTATPDEIKAWDIDVRPDFTGLPRGSGSVKQGQIVWEAKCESCHGAFGEATEVFTPIVGGTTKRDMETGHVANLTRADYPQRTMLMKLSQLSTLWDYIRRAMPWNAPKSLSNDEVYAVTAYILHLGDIVPGDFVLNEKTIHEAQNKLPNRNGLATYAPLWEVSGKGDVNNSACMKDCLVEKGIVSFLPDFARNAHGNLVDQSRLVGATRGARTAMAPALVATVADDAVALATKHNCNACHHSDRKVLGPSYNAISAKYKGQANALDALTVKVRAGGTGVWGDFAMPAHPGLAEAEIRVLVSWILSGGK